MLNIDYCKCCAGSEPTDICLSQRAVPSKKGPPLMGEEKVCLGKMGSRFLLLLNLKKDVFDGVG